MKVKNPNVTGDGSRKGRQLFKLRRPRGLWSFRGSSNFCVCLLRNSRFVPSLEQLFGLNNDGPT
jgi:hypothetical protein